jgi:hypothetical protein
VIRSKMKRGASWLLAICTMMNVLAGGVAQGATVAEAQEVELALDMSFVDWPCETSRQSKAT